MGSEQRHTTIRVSTLTRDKVAAIAKQEGRPMTAVIDDAVAEYEHKKFWEEMHAAVERTRREDPEGWADYVAETAVFDRAASDGLEPEDWSAHLDRKEFDADKPR
ncbi:hypothetical protein IL992_39365 [Microbispora sp. NEAU-D428]|uniref:hypothetical protein n=1 Tax=Microbispora sitophila TaxID=2771537 RepID=UPI001868C1C6|nr:hypothetical protein [Microbispora sitophila]MBE3015183.1 hypothetical protein [Microbispora sitophila]